MRALSLLAVFAVVNARAIGRTVRIDLQPITGSMTQMRVFVRKENLGKDLATASELVTQTELRLAPRIEPSQTGRKVSERKSR